MPSPAKSRGRRKKNERRSDCPMANALDLIGDKWTLLVVRDLQQGCKRYGDFLESPERYPTNILADRLKRLENHGFIRRELYSKHPPRAEYFLTEKGNSLQIVMGAISAWGMANIENVYPYERKVEETVEEEVVESAEPEVVEATEPEVIEEPVAVEEPEEVTVEEEVEEPVVAEPVAETPEEIEETVEEEVEAEEPVEEDTSERKPFEPVVIANNPENEKVRPINNEEDDDQEQMSLWG